MKSFFFTFLVLILVAGLGVGGYFAITSMTDPASYVTANNQVIGDMRSTVTDPDTGTSNDPAVNTVTAAAETTVTAQTVSQSAAAAATSTSTTTNSSSSANATLSSEIATMISDTVSLKQGDKNANVGTIEQFMNLYFNKNSAIDNTFGPSLETSIMTFQKQNKISQTGSVGTSTLQMMQLWLKNNPQ